MVECEFGSVENLTIMNGVLIDTWWNVNVSKPARYYTFDIGFNRYMVECEFLFQLWKLIVDFCFNRYMVECECIPFTYGIWRIPVF